MSGIKATPNINQLYGRDHWSKAWSICLGGAGIVPGAIIGKTNDTGTEVTDRQVDTGDLFHTYLRALGVKSDGQFTIAGQKLPIADLNAMFQEQIKAANTPDKKLLTSDGVHMNPAGNRVMAIGVLQAFGLNEAELKKAQEAWNAKPAVEPAK